MHVVDVRVQLVRGAAQQSALVAALAHLWVGCAEVPGGNCIKIGLPGKPILSKRKGLREVLFS